MSAYASQVKAYLERYQSEVGDDGLFDPHAVAEWAYRNGLHKPNLKTVIDAIATDISQVFREEYRTGEQVNAIEQSMLRALSKEIKLSHYGLTLMMCVRPENILCALFPNGGSKSLAIAFS